MKHNRLYRFLPMLAFGVALWGIPASPALAQTIFADGFEPSCVTDSDADGLADCAETGTGMFVNITHTGTNPSDPDTDGDGLLDGEEVTGTVNGLDLPGLGVSPVRKDILIEYDWIKDATCPPDFSRRPIPEILDSIAAVFAAAPLTNPDGSTGIHVIQDAGQGGLFTGGNEIAIGDGIVGRVNLDEFQFMKALNHASQRIGYFHYAVYARKINHPDGSPSGEGDLLGDDFIVALDCTHMSDLGNTSYINTTIHELGHNLSLQHGGNSPCNYKPNYNSVMNYRYQFYGSDRTCDAQPDYEVGTLSDGSRPPINELAVNELIGVCGSTPIDWNFNGLLEASISRDLNSLDSRQVERCGGVLTVLTDNNDWDALNFSMGVSGNAGAPQQPVVSCLPEDGNPL